VAAAGAVGAGAHRWRVYGPSCGVRRVASHANGGVAALPDRGDGGRVGEPGGRPGAEVLDAGQAAGDAALVLEVLSSVGPDREGLVWGGAARGGLAVVVGPGAGAGGHDRGAVRQSRFAFPERAAEPGDLAAADRAGAAGV